jgi:hypothetical protein
LDAGSDTCGGEARGGSDVDAGSNTCRGEVRGLIDGVTDSSEGESGGVGGPCGGVEGHVVDSAQVYILGPSIVINHLR